MPQFSMNNDGFTVKSREEERAALRELVELLEVDDSDSSRPASSLALMVNSHAVPLPAGISETLIAMSRLLAAGEDLTVTAAKAELTTGEAARLLSLSRQYLVRLCEEGKLPYRMEGTHRRLALQDVLAYRAQRDEERALKFREHTRKAAEAGEYDLPDDWAPQESP